jgi:hypothetical protein
VNDKSITALAEASGGIVQLNHESVSRLVECTCSEIAQTRDIPRSSQLVSSSPRLCARRNSAVISDSAAERSVVEKLDEISVLTRIKNHEPFGLISRLRYANQFEEERMPMSCMSTKHTYQVNGLT